MPYGTKLGRFKKKPVSQLKKMTEKKLDERVYKISKYMKTTVPKLVRQGKITKTQQMRLEERASNFVADVYKAKQGRFQDRLKKLRLKNVRKRYR